ncbi:hypothetical protein M407DRAFT_26947 [Tulasnella calospora MUT 4182]|uniref:Uncharacterized protein n=1 Tax=Tulasnella calospora MUT 4182 TaxID=1051891 RepID=A0A0C3QDB2_9AGAM|nr:hypothetical protein M407DRAFT_26947 [Tulasnella calospora MUT 4182]
MAWKLPESDDSSPPPEYSEDDPPQVPQSYSDASTQTDPVQHTREELTLTIPLGSGGQPDSGPCVVCSKDPATAAQPSSSSAPIGRMHSHESLPSSSSSSAPTLEGPSDVHESLNAATVSLTPSPSVNGYGAQALSEAHSPPHEPVSSFNDSEASDESPEASVASPTSSLNDSAGIDVSAANVNGTLTSMTGEALVMNVSDSIPVTDADNSELETDDNPFIDPDPEEVLVLPQLIASAADTLPPPTNLPPDGPLPAPSTPNTAPAPGPAVTALDLGIQSQAESPSVSGISSLSSSHSSSASFESWTSSEAALAHQIAAAFERIAFNSGSLAQIEAGDEMPGPEANEEGGMDVLSSDSDVEMMDAEVSGN